MSYDRKPSASPSLQDTDKQALRSQLLMQRNSLDSSFIRKAEHSFLRALPQLPGYRQARVVMLYMSFGAEAPTHLLAEKILHDGKKLILPYMDTDFQIQPYFTPDLSLLHTSRFGIAEPDPRRCQKASPDEVDLILIPGVGFDRKGTRLGFGKGCYDRFLPLLRENVPKIALAYSMQLLHSLPAAPHDIPMDMLLTENGLISCCE